MGNYGRTSIEIACIRQALTDRGSTQQLEDFKSLDGDVFFESALENKTRHPDQQKTKPVKEALKALIRETELESGSPFYAVLMMDGDSLGVQMSDLKKQEAISLSLKAFTGGVAEKVEQYSGFLIYAGGDDVLALLPLDKALNCAQALRTHYLSCFRDFGGYTNGDLKEQIKSTLSGAIEYAHIKMPLGKVLADAHHLLDDVAKDEYGRDSIAVRVWKPGGQHLQWAMPWELAIENGKVVLDTLANDFRQTEKETHFSSSFFFNIEARFAMLQSKNAAGKWQLAEQFDADVITQLIAVEYLNSGVTSVTINQAKQDIALLIKQCMPEKRIFTEGEKVKFEPMGRLNIDAAHLLRFLANKGVDHG
jgi:CRISPR-associated protein Cmr2